MECVKAFVAGLRQGIVGKCIVGYSPPCLDLHELTR